MRTALLLAFALLFPPAMAIAQPDPDEDGDVADEADGDEAPAPAKADAAEGDGEADKADTAEADKADTADKADKPRKKRKAPKSKPADDEGDDGDDEAPPKAEPPAEPAADPKAEPAPAEKTVLSEKATDDGRPPLRQRAAGVDGAIGLDRTWSADPGAEGTFRLKFALRWFNATDWPIEGSDNSFLGTTFAAAYSPLPFLETSLAVRSTSNDNPGSRPGLLQTQGDLDLGLKLGHFFTPVIGAGAGVQVHVLGGVGNVGADLDGIGATFKALLTVDLERAAIAPLRILLDVGYTLENGESVYADQAQEPDLIQEWALQAWRYDRLLLALGVEVPVAPYVAPFLEYRIGTPFLVELSRRGRGAETFDFSSVPHTVAGGVRAFPVPEVAVDVTGRFGLSDTPFTGVQSTPPWEVVFGLSYTLDPRPKVVEREVAPVKPAVVRAADVGVSGRVVDEDGKPVSGARIAYSGRDVSVSAHVADDDGRFAGYRFAPGTLRVRVEAEGYLPKAVKTTLKEDKDKKLKIKLRRDPKTLKGKLEIRAFDAKGKPMGAQAKLDDPGASAGELRAEAPLVLELAAGSFTLEVSTAGFKTIRQRVEVKGGESTPIRVAMQRGRGVLNVGEEGARPALTPPAPMAAEPAPRRAAAAAPAEAGPTATLKGKRVQPVGAIEFADGSAKLTGGGKRAVASVAALLKQNAGIKRLQVAAHTDNAGEDAALRALSLQQAQAIKAALVSRGVAADRISVQGLGPDKPIAPNVSARGRARNRRVELDVLEMAP
ncbi:MAG: OmpA family protein [bacterium]